jgi:hypothetical protein
LAGDNSVSTTHWFPSEASLVGTYSDFPNLTTPTTYTCPASGSQPYPSWMYPTANEQIL